MCFPLGRGPALTRARSSRISSPTLVHIGQRHVVQSFVIPLMIVVVAPFLNDFLHPTVSHFLTLGEPEETNRLLLEFRDRVSAGVPGEPR